MNFLKGFANVIGILISIVLSIALLALLICAPVVSATTSFVQTDTIHEMIETIDYSEIIRSNPELSTSLQAMGLDAEMVDQLLHTDLVGSMIDLAVENIISILEGQTPDTAELSAQIDALFDTHTDELQSFLLSLLPEGIPVTNDMIQLILAPLRESLCNVLIESMPTAESLGITPEVTNGIYAMHSGLILQGLIIAIAVLCVLILIFRFPRFKGFLWLGIVFFIGTAFSALIAGAANFAAPLIAVELDPAMLSVAEPFLSMLAEKLWIGTGVILGFAVLFTVIYSVAKVFSRKKEKTSPSRRLF